MADQPVQFSSGLPETVLPEPPAALRNGLAAAGDDRDAIATIVAANPRESLAWAHLGDAAKVTIDAYAAYRVGYHRGLDSLRANGWRGSGYVRGRHAGNLGFLRCLDGLQRMAVAIGEQDEAERCAQFLRQLDPDWRSPA